MRVKVIIKTLDFGFIELLDLFEGQFIILRIRDKSALLKLNGSIRVIPFLSILFNLRWSLLVGFKIMLLDKLLLSCQFSELIPSLYFFTNFVSSFARDRFVLEFIFEMLLIYALSSS